MSTLLFSFGDARLFVLDIEVVVLERKLVLQKNMNGLPCSKMFGDRVLSKSNHVTKKCLRRLIQL